MRPLTVAGYLAFACACFVGLNLMLPAGERFELGSAWTARFALASFVWTILLAAFLWVVRNEESLD